VVAPVADPHRVGEARGAGPGTWSDRAVSLHSRSTSKATSAGARRWKASRRTRGGKSTRGCGRDECRARARVARLVRRIVRSRSPPRRRRRRVWNSGSMRSAACSPGTGERVDEAQRSVDLDTFSNADRLPPASVTRTAPAAVTHETTAAPARAPWATAGLAPGAVLVRGVSSACSRHGQKPREPPPLLASRSTSLSARA